MGQKLVKKLLSGLKKMALPTTTEATRQGFHAYKIGVETADSFKGDPKVLMDALGTFHSSQSRPFFCAGVAYVLVMAAREADGSYTSIGLDSAMRWLEKAQESAPDILLINMIEARIYIYKGNFADARIVLDYLQQQDADSYYLHVAEMSFWQEQGGVEKAGLWYDRAVNSAVNAPQRLRLQAHMGDFYLAQGILDKALVMFKEAAHFDRENHKLWHKISVAFYRQENYEEAQRYNRKVLKMHNYPPAHELETAIKKRLIPGTGKLRRLFGRGR